MSEPNDQADDKGQKQSEGDEGGEDKSGTPSEPKLYDFNGRKLTAEELHREANSLQKDYTEKTTKLSEYEKTKVTEAKNEDDPVLTELKTKYGVITKDDLATLKEEIKKETKAEARQEISFEDELKQLERTWDGKDGKPKFNREEIMAEMQSPGNRIFDPSVLFERKNKDKIQELNFKELKEAQDKIPTDIKGSPTNAKDSGGKEKSYGTKSTEELVEEGIKFFKGSE